ncbi:hypothetical protein D3C75_788510 [compost metagenome]
MRFSCAIKQYGIVLASQFSHQVGEVGVLLHLTNIDLADRQVFLLTDMNTQVGLMHRRDRVSTHNRMAVDPMNRMISFRQCVQVTEDTVTTQCRIARDDRDAFCPEGTCSQLNNMTDAAYSRRAVECGTDLVVNERWRQTLDRMENLGQHIIHLRVGQRTAVSGDSDSIESTHFGQQFRGRWSQEQCALEPSCRENLQRIGRTSEIISIKYQGKIGSLVGVHELRASEFLQGGG